MPHECCFVEEREPSGRLIVGPCIECGRSPMDALTELKKLKAKSLMPRIQVDESLPSGVLELRDESGKLLARSEPGA